jgi:ABC-type sugar transport system permease subunit
MENTLKTTERKVLSKKTKRLLFYIAVVALPVLQFCIFYIYVNFNSLVVAFQRFAIPDSGMGYEKQFAAFDNFRVAFQTIGKGWSKIAMSLRMIACELFIGLPLALVFSFYIYKRFPLAGTFKVMLFMPQIISSIIFVTLFSRIVDEVYKAVFHAEYGLLSIDAPLKTRIATILFYNVWISFGVNVMMFTGTMSGIDGSIVEAAQLDGANIVQEFFHVTMPMIWSTFTTFVVISLTGVFTHQLSLFAFFGVWADDYGLSSFGYFLFIKSLAGNVRENPNFPDELTYSQLAALGIVLTAITLPIVLITRKVMAKLGPSLS